MMVRLTVSFSPCGRRWPPKGGRMRGFAPLSSYRLVGQSKSSERPLIRRALARHLLPQGEKGTGTACCFAEAA